MRFNWLDGIPYFLTADAGADADAAGAAAAAAGTDADAAAGAAAAAAGTDADAGAAAAAAAAAAADATTLDKLLSAETYAAIKDKGYKKFEDLAKGFLNLEQKIGAARTVVPTAESTPEAWEEFFKAAGRPDSADKYELPALPDGLTKDEGLEDFLKQTAFKAGLNPAQTGTFHNAWSEFQLARAKEIETATEKVMDGLKAEWRTDFPAKIDAGKQAISDGAGEDAEAVMHLRLADGRYLLDHPQVARMMANLGEKLGEAGRDPANLVPLGGITTPEAAKAEITRLTADADFQKVFMNKSHKEHDEAVARMRSLHTLANSAKPGAR